jgi:branched-chain amino acid transport system permease protein
MRALGFDVWRHQMAAFIIASGFAGLAGCLYVYFNRFVSPDFLHVVNSAEALIMVILGGVGTLVGPAIGAALIIFLEDAISSQTRHWLFVLGIIYVATTILAPRGVVGLYQSLLARRRAK